jgi:D-glycerate 3-kinase
MAEWPCVEGRPAVILFEGWCVGARPQDESALIEPVNALEREEDPGRTWRRLVNARLGDEYQKLFAELDMLLLLRAPSFETVFAWRKHQEKKLQESGRLKGQDGNLEHVMDDAQLARFIRHYGRLTRHILEEMPGRAEINVCLKTDRTMNSIVVKNG